MSHCWVADSKSWDQSAWLLCISSYSRLHLRASSAPALRHLLLTSPTLYCCPMTQWRKKYSDLQSESTNAMWSISTPLWSAKFKSPNLYILCFLKHRSGKAGKPADGSCHLYWKIITNPLIITAKLKTHSLQIYYYYYINWGFNRNLHVNDVEENHFTQISISSHVCYKVWTLSNNFITTGLSSQSHMVWMLIY